LWETVCSSSLIILKLLSTVRPKTKRSNTKSASQAVANPSKMGLDLSKLYSVRTDGRRWNRGVSVHSGNNWHSKREGKDPHVSLDSPTWHPPRLLSEGALVCPNKTHYMWTLEFSSTLRLKEFKCRSRCSHRIIQSKLPHFQLETLEPVLSTDRARRFSELKLLGC